MSGDARIVVLFHDAAMEVSVSRDVNLPTKHEETV
jgi:hypothetical protein